MLWFFATIPVTSTMIRTVLNAITVAFIKIVSFLSAHVVVFTMIRAFLIADTLV